MISDKDWFSNKYPDGANSSDIIDDIKRKVGDLSTFVTKNKSINPIKIVNYLKN